MPAVELQPDPAKVKGLIAANFDPDHGVVHLDVVVSELVLQGRKPLDEFRALLQEAGFPDRARFYAVVGLRGLASKEVFSPDDERFLLAHTRRLAESPMAFFDDAGYYETLDALGSTTGNSSVLVEWATERLTKKDIPDWRWLAGYALACYSRGRTRQLPMEVIDIFQVEIESEKNPDRREGMKEMAESFRESLQSDPTA